MMLTCSNTQGQGMPTYTYEKRKKTTKERERKVSYMLSRDIIKMM